MEKVINSYESLFVVDVSNGDDAVKATVEKFTALIAANAETVDVSEWGKRRLAYPINYKTEGYYTVVTFKSEPEFPAELERLMNIDENVIRSMLIKLEYDAVAKVAIADDNAENADEASEEATEAEAEVEVAEVAEATEAEKSEDNE